MSEPLESTLSASTSSSADFPVRTSARQVSASESMATDRVYGWSLCESFASFDPATCLWKMSQPCLFEELTGCSETWPPAGLMRNGTCWELIISGRASIENASGYWHTPTTRDFKGQSGRGNRIRRGMFGRLHIANLCDQLVDIGRPDLVRSVTFREWLMGLPIGHTDCEGSAMPSSLIARNGSRSESKKRKELDHGHETDRRPADD